MEVDLLHPGSVPISPDTVLWFEFLIDPNLLKLHLQKYLPDPSSTDLIVKFLSVVPQPQNGDLSTRPVDLENPDSPALHTEPPLKLTKKHLALKILALKIAAYLKWNLDTLETKLPPQTQAQLIQDLVYVATDGAYSAPTQDMSKQLLETARVQFALVLYHRWILRFAVHAALMGKPSKVPFVHIAGMPNTNDYNPMNPNFEKLIRRAESSRSTSLQYLADIVENTRNRKDALDSGAKVKIPVMETFVHLTEDSTDVKHDWDAGELFVSESQFHMQINYDLASNYFYYGQYELAKVHILKCKENMDKLEREYGMEWDKLNYASVSKGNILGYIRALNLGYDLLGEDPSLLQQLQEAITNHYTGIIGVLQADNLKREIPLVYRQVVELDIQGSSSSGIFTVARDLLNRVSALNAVRAVLEGELPSTQPEFNNKFKILGLKFVDMLFWAFAPVLSSDGLSDQDWDKIRTFFLHLSKSQHHFPIERIDDYLSKHVTVDASLIKSKIMAEANLKTIVDDYRADDETNLELPSELLTTDWETPDFNMKNFKDLEIGCLKQRLIDATTADEIRKCLVNLAVTNPSQPLWKVNPQWLLPIPLHSVVMSLPRGFLQDFSYILLGKARQYSETGDHKAALELLLILETETRNQLNQSGSGASQTNPVVYKLCKLVGWEALNTQIRELLQEWLKNKANIKTLVTKSKMCLMSVQSGDSVIPRLEIVEACSICLLNACEWQAPTWSSGGGGGAGAGAAHLAGLTAAACLELQRHKAAKKMARELWDAVLSAYCNNSTNTTKRNAAGNAVNTSANRNDAPLIHNKLFDNVTAFYDKLRDPTVVTVVLSLLARIFNILNDDSNVDLNIEYIILWPSIFANTNTYSIKSVTDSIYRLLSQSLRYYPNHVPWIKLLGDMNLAQGHYAASLKNYLTVLTVMSDYFVHPLSKQLLDDQTIFKRMIKCCTQLNCHTQAAILCQFLDDVDYVLAFKCLSEKSHLCADAMDSYYGCIWDTTILEFLINLHHKRGENQRKQTAIKVMGMLELNSNNNEEIQREATNSRKAKFMRALVKQYLR